MSARLGTDDFQHPAEHLATSGDLGTGHSACGATVEDLKQCLAEGPTATAALARWCERQGIGHGHVRAEIVASGSGVEAGGEAHVMPASVAERLCTKRPAWRRVRLCRGDAALSEALLHYRDDWLSASMRRALAERDTPFGAVVAPLGPRRRLRRSETASAIPVHGRDQAAAGLLAQEAELLLPDGRVLAVAEETYLGALIGL